MSLPFLRFARSPHLALAFTLGLVALFVTESRASASPARCPSLQTATITTSSVTTGRLGLDGVPSTCGTTKAFPSSNAASTVHFATFPYENRTTADACVNVTVTATKGEVETAAYLRQFTPSNPAAGYLGDPGGSASALTGATKPTQSYSINVPALAQFVIMVEETVLSAGGSFSLSVTNCGDVITTGVSPAFGPMGGGQALTVSGGGFLAGATATLGGTPLTTANVTSEGTLTGLSGAHTSGAVDVVVTNSDGTHSTLANGYMYMALAPSTVQLTSTLSSVVGEPVVLKAQVSGSNPPAALGGKVTFLDGSTLLGGPIFIDSNGVAAFTTAALLTAGSHTITATFDGGTYFAPSTSAPLTQTVAKASTYTTLGSANSNWRPGVPLTFTATVSTIAPGSGVATGTVAFSEGSVPLGTAPLDSSGIASWTTSGLTVGTHVINAAYVGDANYAASAGSFSQAIIPGATNETLTSSAPQGAVYGWPVTFTVSLAGSGGAPGGTVVFAIDGANATVPVDATGMASFIAPALSVGTHDVSATYSGDASDAPTQSYLSQDVVPSTTTTAITSSLNPATVTDTVTVTATVSAPNGTPTGAVQFDYPAMGTSVVKPVVNGRSSFTFTNGAVGAHTIVATYEGDGNFTGSTSASFDETIVGGDGGDGDDAAAPTPGDASAPNPDDAGYPQALPDAGAGEGDDAGFSYSTDPVGTIPPLSRDGCGCSAAGVSSSGSLAIFGIVALAGAMGRRRRERE